MRKQGTPRGGDGALRGQAATPPAAAGNVAAGGRVTGEAIPAGQSERDGRGVAAVVLAAAAWAGYVTRHGLSITEDSATYLGVARNLQLGNGARLAFDEPGRWLDVFPPGLPLLLAAGRPLGLELVDWGRLVTIALLAGNAFLIMSIVRRLAPRPAVVAPLAGVLFVLARGTVEVHERLLSEPLYLLLELLAIRFLLARTSSRRPQLLLAAAALAAGLSLLTRFAGLATIGACAVWLLLAERGPAIRRVATAAGFTALAAVPFATWSLISAALEQSVNRRGAALHPASARHVRVAVSAFSEWLLPARAGPVVTGLGALAVTSIVVVVGWRAMSSVLRPGPRSPLVLLVLVAGSHVALVLATIYFVAEGNYLDRRSLLPSYAAMLPAAAAVLPDLAGRLPSRRLVRAATAGLVVAAAALQVPSVVSHEDDDLDLASPAWQEDPVLARLRALPAGAIVYSNIPSVIWFNTGIGAHRFPGTDVRSGERGTASSPAIEELVASLQRCGGAVVAFDREVVQHQVDARNNAAILGAVGGPVEQFDGTKLIVVRPDAGAGCST